MPKKTYREWLLEVDAYCQKHYGLSYQDLSDYNYADAYEDGKSAAATARAARKASE